jgi:hypothetical protein
VIVLPQGITERLTHAEFEAVIAHELCHARRRDNLAAAIHMLVESLFWFHPLVWWLGARMVEERERACDEAVLELGGEPQIYAESIVKVCRFYLESPLPCVAGVTGSDLKKRVERIMHKRIGSNLPAWRKTMITGLGVAAILGPVAVGLFNAPAGRAQGGEGITGVWIGKATGAEPGREPKTDPLSLNLRQNGNQVTGGLVGARMEIPITSGHVEGDKVILEVSPQAQFELHLANGRLAGEASILSKDGSGRFKVRVDLARVSESDTVRIELSSPDSQVKGPVFLSVQVDPSGKPFNIRVLHSGGLGMDVQAMEAAKKLTLRPGVTQVIVSFRPR